MANITKEAWERYEANPDYLIVEDAYHDERFLRSPCDCDLFKIGAVYVDTEHNVWVGVAEISCDLESPDSSKWRFGQLLKMIA